MESCFTYEEFMRLLNAGKIKEVNFYIKDYAHYKNCSITVKPEVYRSGNCINSVIVKLTNDSSEEVSFFQKFNEKFKLFDFGRNRRFTLKQVWDKVVISNIEFAEEKETK